MESSKKMILKGVGSFMAKKPTVGGGTEIITLGKLQDLKITLNTELDDIFGGDGFFPIDNLVKSKSIEVVATDAKFDLAALELMMGASGSPVADDNYIWVLGEEHTVTGSGTLEVTNVTVDTAPTVAGNITVTLGGVGLPVAVKATETAISTAKKIAGAINSETDFTAVAIGKVVSITAVATGDKTDTTASVGITLAGITVAVATQGVSGGTATVTLNFGSTIFSTPDKAAAELTVRNKDSNKLLTAATTSGTVDVDKPYYLGSNGIITVDTSLANATLVFNYKRADEAIDMYAIMANEIPFIVTVVHHGSFMQKDGTFQGIETELYQCRAKGQFVINSQRATASTTEVTLHILDPERADGRLGTIKRYSATSKV